MELTCESCGKTFQVSQQQDVYLCPACGCAITDTSARFSTRNVMQTPGKTIRSQEVIKNTLNVLPRIRKGFVVGLIILCVFALSIVTAWFTGFYVRIGRESSGVKYSPSQFAGEVTQTLNDSNLIAEQKTVSSDWVYEQFCTLRLSLQEDALTIGSLSKQAAYVDWNQDDGERVSAAWETLKPDLDRFLETQNTVILKLNDYISATEETAEWLDLAERYENEYNITPFDDLKQKQEEALAQADVSLKKMRQAYKEFDKAIPALLEQQERIRSALKIWTDENL